MDEGQENLGRLPGIRPGETSEFFDTMRNCPTDLPFFTLNGNRDIGNHIFAEHAWKGYEKQFMDRLLSIGNLVEPFCDMGRGESGLSRPLSIN